MSILTQIGELISSPSIGLARQAGRLSFPREYKILSDDEKVSVSIDTVVEERHESSLSLTQYAVEQGADMTDHYSVNPAVFSLTGLISDVSENEFIDYAIPASWSSLFSGGDVGGTRSQLAWLELTALQASGVFVTFTSQLRTYSHMLITRLAVTQGTDTSNGIFFEMELKEVRVAELEVVKGVGVFKTKNPKKGKKSTAIRNGKSVQKGLKQGSPVPARKTALAKGAEYFGI